MLENVSYGPNGYAIHEDSYDMENEYRNNYSSMQMMPPHYSKQHMTYSSGTHGAYPDGGWNVKPMCHNAWDSPYMHQNGWSSTNGYCSYASGGRYPGMTCPTMAPGRMPNCTMVNAEYETYQAVPGRIRMQNYGVQSESYDDFANRMHNGHHNVEWKSL